MQSPHVQLSACLFFCVFLCCDAADFNRAHPRHVRSGDNGGDPNCAKGLFIFRHLWESKGNFGYQQGIHRAPLCESGVVRWPAEDLEVIKYFRKLAGQLRGSEGEGILEFEFEFKIRWAFFLHFQLIICLFSVN